MGFLVLKSGVTKGSRSIGQNIINMVYGQIGAFTYFRQVVVVNHLPWAHSGKILRGSIRKIAYSDEFSVPSTIDELAVLCKLTESMEAIGYQPNR